MMKYYFLYGIYYMYIYIYIYISQHIWPVIEKRFKVMPPSWLTMETHNMIYELHLHLKHTKFNRKIMRKLITRQKEIKVFTLNTTTNLVMRRLISTEMIKITPWPIWSGRSDWEIGLYSIRAVVYFATSLSIGHPIKELHHIEKKTVDCRLTLL